LIRWLGCGWAVVGLWLRLWFVVEAMVGLWLSCGSPLSGHSESSGFSKPGSNNYSESTIWRPTLLKLWVRGGTSAASSVVAELTMPTKPATVYGAPHTVYLNLSFARTVGGRGSVVRSGGGGGGGGGGASKLRAADDYGPGALLVNLELITLGKLPTMVGESSSFSFTPAPRLVGRADGASGWAIDKLGGTVDPEGVQDGGNQYVMPHFIVTSPPSFLSSHGFVPVSAPEQASFTVVGWWMQAVQYPRRVNRQGGFLQLY
jgi:hypothetical protein